MTIDKFLEGRKIIVVDDEEMQRTLFAEFLKMAGAEAHIFEKGRDAIAYASSSGVQYDLALLDFLGHLKGDIVARELKKIDANLPIVYVTGTPGEIPAGNTYPVLEKPYMKQNLYDFVKEHIRKAPAP